MILDLAEIRKLSNFENKSLQNFSLNKKTWCISSNVYMNFISNWNKQYCKTDSDKDQMALSRHYSENHGTTNKQPLHEVYTVTFVEQPSCHSLDICENKWYHLIDAQINIQNMILPHVK